VRSKIRALVAVIATCAPISASNLAVVKPIPDALPAPVTSAACPWSEKSLCIVLRLFRRFDGDCCIFSRFPQVRRPLVAARWRVAGKRLKACR
jgi:hypothetical protein